VTPRPLRALLLLCLLSLLGIIALLALGDWQLHRRHWKLDLIARVDQRIHAAPVAAPGPAQWPMVSDAHDSYRHVVVRGVFLHDRETLVHAVTEHGPGDWVLTPLKADAGFTVLVNRGFVPPDRRAPETRAAGQIAGEVTVTGLMRMSEPKGAFLHSNAPAAGRWYSRDVAAIAAARGLSNVAPYFMDADATPNPGGLPVGGLTVISFRNDHLIYAITWFGLAGMVTVFIVVLLRQEYLVRHAKDNPA
jgi:surfeit locus 1 family protein